MAYRNDEECKLGERAMHNLGLPGLPKPAVPVMHLPNLPQQGTHKPMSLAQRGAMYEREHKPRFGSLMNYLKGPR